MKAPVAIVRRRARLRRARAGSDNAWQCREAAAAVACPDQRPGFRARSARQNPWLGEGGGMHQREGLTLNILTISRGLGSVATAANDIT